MKAITFLGAAPAHETTYVMPDGRTHDAPYFGAALARFVPDLDMRVFVTRGARERHLDEFTRLVEDNVRQLIHVDIPDGSTQEEMWEIFQAVVDNVAEEEEVVFDITHGFRSLPFLSFLAAAYLREVKDADLRAVYYGNWEARDQSVVPNRAPVFDLSEFVQLLDWMIATDYFTKTGDSSELASLMERAKPDFRTATEEEKRAWQDSTMGQTIGTLKNLSMALQFVRPYDAMVASAKLHGRITDAVDDYTQFARPYAPLARRVSAAYEPLALVDPNSDPWKTLEIERELVVWFLDRHQYVQAVAVAREWLVSWTMLQSGYADILDRRQRELVGKGITALLPKGGNYQDDDQTPDLAHVTKIGEVVKVYDKLGVFRNDLLHAGKNKNAQAASKLESGIRNECKHLANFPIAPNGSAP
jgi:CRISPR-associated Csx2 family protein